MNRETPIAENDATPAGEGAPSLPSAEGATPMMEQFIEIKSVNPDSLLFYRMGDFYELFFHDAEVASRALGIALTKRGKHQGQDIPMCGVPVHAADDYLQRLIALGHRVAVCEQIEDPAEAKKRGSKSVVKRDVVRLVTPGTITEDKLLSPSDTNYLMALGRARQAGEPQYALAWIDISTGAFFVAETAPDRLLSDVLSVDPRELILPEPVFADLELRPLMDALGRVASPQPPSLFDSATAETRVARFFDVATIEGFGSFSRPQLSAIGGAVAYVEKTQKNERPPLQRPVLRDASGSLFIDAATRANLEIMRTLSGSREGSLFSCVDRTVTGPGARLLGERLTAPLTDPDAIARRLDSVSHFSAERRMREALRDALKSVPDMLRALSRLALRRGGPRDLGALRNGLAQGREIASLLDGAELPAELGEAYAALAALPAALSDHLSRALAEELPLLARDGGFVRAGHDSELDEARALRDQARRVIAEMERALADETGIRSLKIRHNNVLGYYIEVTANHREIMTGSDEAKARFIHRQTMANAMRFTTTELAELESKIANAADRALTIEQRVFAELVDEAVAEAEGIRQGARALAVLDVATALATLAGERDWSRPVVDDSLSFRIEAARHPVVEEALRRQLGDPFVANDCDLSPAEGGRHGAIWLLTGPNMGGKSTFLRQNALIAILAQAGAYVPARSAHIGVVDRLFSRVGASDDLARGRSTFMVEMVETATILNQAGERSLVILDEIGRGTATYDGLSIAWAALEHLHEQNRCRTLFATHFHEMTSLSERLARLSNVTMRVKEWEGDVVFLHEVARGAADRSYGVQVARLAGLPEAVVERAREVLRMLEEGETSGRAARIVDDLPLFSAAVRKEPPPPAKTDTLREEVQKILPDEISPREALDVLYRLKALAGKQV
ncbi:MAG: DNA mismatch repair protein MutS [Aliihoeflea sp.]